MPLNRRALGAVLLLGALLGGGSLLPSDVRAASAKPPVKKSAPHRGTVSKAMPKAKPSLQASMPVVPLAEVPTQAAWPRVMLTVPLLPAPTTHLPAKLTSAEQVMAALSNPSLGVHMEALRRGRLELPHAEQQRLMSQLVARREALSDDPVRFFDLGYADVLYRRNKTGLFFLRKANDRLANNPWTSLAYAMGQADVDLELDREPADATTVRKMDVGYKLTDAITRQTEATAQAGFWPAFVSVVQALGAVPAYSDLTRKDYSLAFVPQGKTSVPFTARPASASSPGLACLTQPARQALDWSQVTMTREVDLLNAGTLSQVHFMKSGSASGLKALVVDPRFGVLASDVETAVGPNVFEDLDGDGVYELVVRQYSVRPLEPVRVYRFQNCAYQLDTAIQQRFQ